ncbi:MAG TPA: radical SAM protein, partial [bacterium]|nr:radical SAM protein [bacterium]
MKLNKYEIRERKNLKFVKSPEYNYIFNSENGFFARWGKTKEDDPQFSPFGPELLDVEISTICSNGCSWCYKSNTSTGKNMSFSTFKKILY